jgi:hypothetical protein
MNGFRLALSASRSVSPVVFLLLLGACSSAPRTTPRLSDLIGKRVALIEIEGEATQRSMIEVALVNNLQREGSFELISKEELQQAKTAPDVDTSDDQALGRKLKADYVLRIRALNFDASERQGYDRVKMEDSQLAAERGESARMTQRLVKVKSLTGTVALKIRFTPVAGAGQEPASREATQTVTDTVRATEEKGAIRLPEKMSFLSRLTQRALDEFFKQYEN